MLFHTEGYQGRPIISPRGRKETLSFRAKIAFEKLSLLGSNVRDRKEMKSNPRITQLIRKTISGFVTWAQMDSSAGKKNPPPPLGDLSIV